MSGNRRLILVAACALIDVHNRVLISRRPQGKHLAGLWEFPGGKMESGEGPEQAVIRELGEELGIALQLKSLIPLTFASHAYPEFHLLMTLFACREWTGLPTANEGQDIAWIHVEELQRRGSQFPMPPADAPLLPALRTYLG